MKVILDISEEYSKDLLDELSNDNRVNSILNINDPKTQILLNLKEAVEELKLIKEGKSKARPVEELLNEL